MKPAIAFLISFPLFAAGSFQDAAPVVANYTLSQKLDAGIVETVTNTTVGNPADGLLVTDVVQTGPRNGTFALMRNSFVYTPATSGSVQSINASLDVRIDVLNGQLFGTGWELWIQQGSKFYFHDFAGPATENTFLRLGGTGVQAANFSSFDFNTGVINSSEHPNFGQPMTFGFGSINGYNYAGMGTDTIQLYFDNFSVTINSGGPAIGAGAILNSASFAAAPVAAGSLVSVFGTELAPAIAVATVVPLPFSLGGVSVTVGGIPAAIHFVSPTQINVQIPWNVTGAAADMIITTNGVVSPPASVALGTAKPGIYTADGSGTGQAFVFINPDYAVAGPAGNVRGLPSRPALGSDPNANNRDVLIIYASGLGPVDSTLPNGANSIDKLRTATAPIQVLVGGIPAQLIFAGLTPQFVGIYQINVRMPAGVTPGNAVPIQLVQNGNTSTNLATIAVR